MQGIPALKPPSGPWYREPWPWLLMAGPAAVIVAGVYTAMLAFGSSDGLVADDYYKQGLAINRTLARERAAAALGLEAAVSYSADSGRVRVEMRGERLPRTVVLRMTHPTRVGQDRKVELSVSSQAGVYEGRLDLPGTDSRWNAVLETPEWRLAGVWTDPRHAALRLAASRS